MTSIFVLKFFCGPDYRRFRRNLYNHLRGGRRRGPRRHQQQEQRPSLNQTRGLQQDDNESWAEEVAEDEEFDGEEEAEIGDIV